MEDYKQLPSKQWLLGHTLNLIQTCVFPVCQYGAKHLHVWVLNPYNSKGRYCCWPHCTGEETEAQKIN